MAMSANYVHIKREISPGESQEQVGMFEPLAEGQSLMFNILDTGSLDIATAI